MMSSPLAPLPLAPRTLDALTATLAVQLWIARIKSFCSSTLLSDHLPTICI